MKVTIELAPGTVKRALILGGGLLMMGAAALALAVPVTYSEGSVLTAKSLNDNFANVEQRLAALEVNERACPAAYTQDTSITGIVDCKNGDDEVVKVGNGPSAFWIDRYESSVWDGANQRFGSADDSLEGGGFPKNGQSSNPWVAKSVSGKAPARFITWFQAQQACRASGKRLPNGEEWLAAGRGTPDPTTPTATDCNISGANSRDTGQGTTCQSHWGAQDMIGNLWEWTADWHAGLGDTTTSSNWPSDYGSDGAWNITSSANSEDGATLVGAPVAAVRGGSWDSGGTNSGLFALALSDSPTFWRRSRGFRCLLPR
jgi:formylglycine-generating enzyme required for sulfatase activity